MEATRNIIIFVYAFLCVSITFDLILQYVAKRPDCVYIRLDLQRT